MTYLFEKKSTLYILLKLGILVIFLAIISNLLITNARQYTQRCNIDNDICTFGDEWFETDAENSGNIENISCIYGGGTVSKDWIPNKKFFCVANGAVSTERQHKLFNEPDYTYIIKFGEGWVICDSSTSGFTPGDIFSVSDLVGREIEDKRGTTNRYMNVIITYYWKGGSLNGRCQKCNSRDIKDCPGYISAPPIVDSNCNISTTSDTCSFGNLSSRDPNSNCATATDSRSNRKIETNGGVTYTYFCSTRTVSGGTGNATIRCEDNLPNISYNEIFDKGTSAGTGSDTYEVIKGTYSTKCRTVEQVRNQEECSLADTSDSDTSCKFGPFISNSTSQYKNCAFKNESKNVGGKFVYCAPDNKKISCNSKTSYETLFAPLQTGTGLDFEGKTSSNLTTAARNNGCELYRPEEGCNVSATPSADGSCRVPESCYTSNNVVKSKIGNKDVALYCVSKSSRDVKDGFIYACPLGPGKEPYDYPLIADLESSGFVSLQDEQVFDGERKTLTSVCDLYTEGFITLSNESPDPLSPLGLIRSISNFLYFFAIFYFIVLVLTNAFAYVRAAEDPGKLKEITQSLFNTVSGLLFVILAGGVIVYLINQI